MTTKKSTKSALLSSVMATALCIAMLIGTTFAWFTDNVTSGKNKIVAGNLDVELEYSTNGTTWNKADANTNLFKPTEGEGVTLWEPGHTEYVYIRVSNVGSLALKYQFLANVYGDENGGAEKEYTNQKNEKFKLSEYLVFNKIDGTAPVAQREDLWLSDEDEQAAMGKLDGVGETGVLLPGASEALTLAVYMPTQVGNEANALTGSEIPTIYLGLTLNATQAPSERDSFGNDYDVNADGTPDNPEWGAIGTDKVTAPVNPNGETELANEKIRVSVPKEAAAENTLVLTVKPTDKPENVQITGEQAAQAYEITLQGLKPDNTKPVTVTLFIGKGLTGVKLYHNATEVPDATYDSNTGIITFTTTSFSPFTVVCNKALAVSDEKNLRNALLYNGAEITLTADITATDVLCVQKDVSVTLNLNGKKLVTPADKFQITLLNRGNLTVKNGAITNMNTDSKFGNSAIASVSGNLVLEDCVISNKAGISGSYCVQVEGGTATLTNCTINGDRGGLAVQDNGQVVVNGGTISAAYYYPLYIYGNGHSTFNNTKFVKIPKLDTQAGNGGNAVIYNDINPKYGDIGTAVFTGCTFSSTRDGGSKFEIFNFFNGFTLNDCVFENVTDTPTE